MVRLSSRYLRDTESWIKSVYRGNVGKTERIILKLFFKKIRITENKLKVLDCGKIISCDGEIGSLHMKINSHIKN